VRSLKVAALALLASVAAWAMLGGTAQGQPAPGACGYYTNSLGHSVPRPCGNWHAGSGTKPSGAAALCGDGTYSYSEHPYSGGTCSHHGGVTQYLE
jgi:hypothetical protein